MALESCSFTGLWASPQTQVLASWQRTESAGESHSTHPPHEAFPVAFLCHTKQLAYNISLCPAEPDVPERESSSEGMQFNRFRLQEYSGHCPVG